MYNNDMTGCQSVLLCNNTVDLTLFISVHKDIVADDSSLQQVRFSSFPHLDPKKKGETVNVLAVNPAQQVRPIIVKAGATTQVSLHCIREWVEYAARLI